MKIDVTKSPYSLMAGEKKIILGERLHELSVLHYEKCSEYQKICDVCGCNPMLPVGLFKDTMLSSTGERHKIITSSGTTGQKKSQVIIDGRTATLQQQALAVIGTDFLGSKRLPMLVIDCPSTISDKNNYSARTAAILGFSIFVTRRTWALNDDMSLNTEAIDEFLKMWGKGIFLVFGFTYIVWQYLYETNVKIDLSNGILIHGGGWKKLQNLGISRKEFREKLGMKFGITKIHDYYGMAEQAGSIFMECECGHLHCSDFSDVIIRRASDFSEAVIGEKGLIQVVSAIPESYPGHNLLTEDEGILLGVDDCPCGRKGKYFSVIGRVKAAELRGCSDIRAIETEHKLERKLNYIVGKEIDGDSLPAFSGQAVEFLDCWSRIIRQSKKDVQDAAFGFWIRRSNLIQMSENVKDRKGCGTCFIITPSNIPSLWAYNLALAVMTGNSAIIKMPSVADESSNLIRTLKIALEKYPFWEKRIALVKYGHDKEITDRLSENVDIRVIWGGNDSITEIQKSRIQPGAKEIVFPTRHSAAVIDAGGLNDSNMSEIIHNFYNDTYLTDQNACSSPNVIIWRGNYESTRDKFWKALWKYLKGHYEVLESTVVLKWQKAMLLAADGKTEKISHEDNLIVRVWADNPDESIWNYVAPGGFFIETTADIENIKADVVQTVAFYGCQPDNISDLRCVPGGHTLDFSAIWDGHNLLKEMTVNE